MKLDALGSGQIVVVSRKSRVPDYPATGAWPLRKSVVIEVQMELIDVVRSQMLLVAFVFVVVKQPEIVEDLDSIQATDAVPSFDYWLVCSDDRFESAGYSMLKCPTGSVPVVVEM